MKEIRMEAQALGHMVLKNAPGLSKDKKLWEEF
jgi:hypothetical protein